MKKTTINILLLFIALLVNAQDKTNELSGFIMHKQESGFNTSLDGANIFLIYAKDTLKTTSVNGTFRFKPIKTGKAKLIVTAMGCRKVEKELNIIAGKNPNLYIDILDESIQLEEVTIKGRIPIVTQNGDTLIFNPKAVNVQEGDVAMNIVEQLPGAETDEHSVQIMGKQVTKTYIDGKLIFGSDPMAALKNLSATDVLKIKAYDEYENTKTKKLMYRGDLTRVLNIETKSKLISSWKAHLLASAGSNLDSENSRGKFRKGLGLTANFFSENFLLTGNAFHNNINRKSNNIKDVLSISNPESTFKETTYADLAMERSWNTENGTYGGFTAFYTFGYDRDNTDTRSEQLYFPDNNYQQRLYEEQNSNSDRKQNHYSELSFSNSNDKWGALHWNQLITYNNNKDWQSLYIYNEVNNLQASKSLMHYGNLNKSFHVMERISYTNGITDRFGYTLESSIDINKGNDHSLRVDTLESSITQTYLTIPSKLRNTEWNGNVQLMYILNPETESQLSLDYSVKYENGWKHQFAWNMLNPTDPQTDEANTYSYKVNNLIQKQEVSLHFSPYEKTSCDISAGLKESTLNRKEKDIDNYQKTFISPTVKLSLVYSDITNSWNTTYMLHNLVPNIVQLRPQIDNSNPYMLRSGNPNLKQSYLHSFLFNYSRMLGKHNHTLGVAINTTIRQHSPVAKTTYYNTETYLPELQYTAPAHSSLISFENVEGYWDIKGKLIWQAPIRSIKSKYILSTGFNYEHNPYYIGENKTTTRTYDPSLEHSLLCNLTKKLKITVSTNTRYIHSINTENYTGKTFYQTAGTTVDISQICKHFYLSSHYLFIFSRDYGINKEINRNHTLNLNIGCKVLNRKGDISIAAYDLLNSHRTFSSQMYSNYIQNTWTNYYGRFFTINFAYRFGKVKSNYEGNTNDGSIREYRSMPGKI